MSWKTTVLCNAFNDGAWHCFLLPRSLLIFTACLHIHISKVDATMNDTSVRIYVEPSPSLKHPSTEAIQRHTKATLSLLYNDVSNNATRTNYETAAVGLFLKRQITWLNNGSGIVGHNIEEAENHSHIRKDKSVIFYKRVSFFLAIYVILHDVVT